MESLDGYGVDKLLIVNGHGGNDFRQIVREVGAAYPDMLLATCNWFQSVDQGKIFEKPFHIHEGVDAHPHLADFVFGQRMIAVQAAESGPVKNKIYGGPTGVT